ncbi:MAG: tRNA pseudouridine(13) synthase TruD [Polyangiales bacterium]
MPPSALFKSIPEDFFVEEIDSYPASGSGTHTILRIRKRGLTTDAALMRLARALEVDVRGCGAAGIKDKDAITIQRVSLPNVDPSRAMELAGRYPDLEVLEAVRHGNKLKPGHLHGNRFTIRLRDITFGAPQAAHRGEFDGHDTVANLANLEALKRALERLGVEGCPNSFGPQRFGRDGDNAARALAFVRGDERPPRDPRARRFLFSALQSRWFNALLDARVHDGSFRVPQMGDLLKKHDSGGLFLCDDPDTDRARAEAFELSPTGPIFGSEMPRPGDAIFARESAVLETDSINQAQLEAHRALGAGTRRSLRLRIESMQVALDGLDLLVTMTLPKGAYATIVLGQVVTLKRALLKDTPEAPGEDAELC